MNETLKTILNRRSIRKYKIDQINNNDLDLIIEAGKYAPCGLNQQSSHFTVIQNKKILEKINNICKEFYLKSGVKTFEQRAKSENFNVYYNAPTFIIVSGDKNSPTYINNGSASLENMLLAAESLGLGSCWIHSLSIVFPTEEGKILKKELGIPDDYNFVGAAIFGYKNMEPPLSAPRKENTLNIIR
ncbi:MAG: nitroreductase family protein [Fusobacteriaceae bacterium]|nr:nitroreductase family protein [Fusobacteriaceae bacterium]MBN2838073.1 nitroreductase family protein [Fusobacteriaceae bacterium]